MNTRKNAPLSLRMAQEIVYGLTQTEVEERSKWSDFYQHALYEACEVQNINQDEYKLLIDIVQVLAPEE